MFKVNNKNTDVSFVEFEQVNVCWVEIKSIFQKTIILGKPIRTVA